MAFICDQRNRCQGCMSSYLSLSNNLLEYPWHSNRRFLVRRGPAEAFITKYHFQGYPWDQCRTLTQAKKYVEIHRQKFLNALAVMTRKTIFVISIQRISSQVFQWNTQRLYAPHQSNNWRPLNCRKVTKTQCAMSQFMLLCKPLHLCYTFSEQS